MPCQGREPEQQVQVGPQDPAADVAGRVQQVVPVDAQVDETQQVSRAVPPAHGCSPRTFAATFARKSSTTTISVRLPAWSLSAGSILRKRPSGSTPEAVG